MVQIKLDVQTGCPETLLLKGLRGCMGRQNMIKIN